MDRRTFLNRGAGALLGATGAGVLASAAAQDVNQAAGMISPTTQGTIDRSLAWLAGQQNRQDGSFGTGNYAGHVAVTSLAGLALMAGGFQPGRGRFGENVTRAVEYIVRNCEDRNTPGFLNSPRGFNHGPMYGHGFATLFLAEVYGMVNTVGLRNDLRGCLGRAVRLILSSQNAEGGWRYNPRPHDADLSVTICQIMALRAARNAGLSVPRANRDRCVDYVRRCQGPDGGFRYQPFGGPSGFARTAAGVVALYSAGVYSDPAITRGLDYLNRFRPGGGGGMFGQPDFHYYYGHYYAVQAMWIAGG
ncbi:MAG: terpene cyclase/mutase family protein, partial [Planctomycetes bacterium]|nr:terpene cyclase/mutase family protein [Planctomycetota bacterium]